jgi:hypothetical protein
MIYATSTKAQSTGLGLSHMLVTERRPDMTGEKQFIQEIERTYARMRRLRNVVLEDRWDDDLEPAWDEFMRAVNDLRAAYALIP